MKLSFGRRLGSNFRPPYADRRISSIGREFCKLLSAKGLGSLDKPGGDGCNGRLGDTVSRCAAASSSIDAHISRISRVQEAPFWPDRVQAGMDDVYVSFSRHARRDGCAHMYSLYGP